jgi:hypothetical protein
MVEDFLVLVSNSFLLQTEVIESLRKIMYISNKTQQSTSLGNVLYVNQAFETSNYEKILLI